ncbi:MAG TPA: DMT family transporter, partial [Polyangiaceae bacterium]|nr:DMT family transporter [Polyangiaceae bacterium]
APPLLPPRPAPLAPAAPTLPPPRPPMPLRLWRELSPGTRAMAASAFFFSVMSAFVKLAGARLPASHVVLGRGVVTLALSYWGLRRAGVSPLGVDRTRLALRGLFGFLALNCYFTSLKQLPLADATVLQYSSPVFTALFAALALGERMRPAEVGCVVVSFAGVLLVGRPAFLFGAAANVAAGPLAVALAGSVCSAVAYVLVRRLRRTDRPEAVVFYFPLVAVPLSIPPVLAEATWPTPLEWLWLLGVGVFTQAGQVALTRALHAEAAGRAASMSFLQIVFAYGWGLLLFHERPTLLGTLGSLVVAAGTIALARLKSAPAVPPPAPLAPARASGRPRWARRDVLGQNLVLAAKACGRAAGPERRAVGRLASGSCL